MLMYLGRGDYGALSLYPAWFTILFSHLDAKVRRLLENSFLLKKQRR